MNVTYRREPGRVVMRIDGMSLTERIPRDQARTITLNLGHVRAQVPQPLDWSPEWEPVTVTHDPLGRVWEPIYGSDTGTACELHTPWPNDAPFAPD